MKRTDRDNHTSVTRITRRTAVLGGVQLGVLGLLGLVMDFLFFKVPGAWTLILLVSTEVLRKSSEQEGNSGFVYETIAVIGTVFGAFLGHRALLALFGAPQPPLGGTLLELVFTLLAYPLVVLATVFIFRIRRPDLHDALSFKIRS